VPHVSTGELFRTEVANGTPLGQQAQRYLDRGELVPDDLVLDLVAHRLGKGDVRGGGGYLLDGFPRTLSQAQALFEVLGASAADLAVEIHVPTSVVLPRLAARRVCRSCGNATTALPGSAEVGVCGQCGGQVVRRDDDTDEAIARRLALYDEQSGPLLVWLDSQALLVTVDGVGSPESVHRRVLDAVAARIPNALGVEPAAGLADAG
jgi:adenylate kinase